MDWSKVLAWLEKWIPAFLLGYKLGKSEKQEIKTENAKLKLQIGVMEDEKRIRDHVDDLRNDDLREQIIRRARSRKDH